jgi:hypothetical protein
MMSWPNLWWYVFRNRWYRMLSWTILKCYVDWKGCDRKYSGIIWSSMWIRTDDRGWCHELIWRDTWIGTHDKGCCLVQIKMLCGLYRMWHEVLRPMRSNIWIRTEETGWCLALIWGDFEWKCCECMLSLHYLKCYMDWNGCGRTLSRPIWSTMWNKTDCRGWCLDLIWGVFELEQIWNNDFMT